MTTPTVSDNLVFTHGSVWAVWRVPTSPYQYQPARHQRSQHAAIQSTLTALTDPAIWLSVCRELTPADVMDRMAASSDRDAWLRTVTAAPVQLAALTGGGALFERHTYLCTQLPARRAGWRDLAAAWMNATATTAGVPQRGPGVDEIARLTRQADQLASSMAGLGLTRAPVQEVAWLYRRRWLRAIAPPGLAVADDGPGDVEPLTPSDGDAVLWEGGTGDDTGRPDHRRFVRVDTPWGTGFQTALVVAETPQQWTFPGGNGEWLAAVDLAPWPVEWSLRLHPVANDVARRQAKSHARQLSAQWDQHDGDPDRESTFADLQRASDAVTGHLDELAATPSAPELLNTTTLSLAAPTLPALEDQAQRLMGLFTGVEYLMARPTGDQTRLLEAMLPGASVPMRGPTAWMGSTHPCSHYRQWMLPKSLATAMPTAGGIAGDDTGMLLGVNRDAPGTPILFDPAAGPPAGRSGSMAVFGVLGAGKSYLLKRCAHAVVARGGVVVALDRTEQGEYGQLAHAMPGTTQTVTLGPGADACLDPLAMFADPDQQQRYAIGFLTQLTGVRMSTAIGVALGQAVKQVVADGGRMADVADTLAAMACDVDVTDLVASLRYLAQEPLARVAFGTDTTPLSLTADYIVVSTAGLALPDRHELDRRDELLPEQIVSQALLYLVAAAAKRVVFTRRDRFGVAMFDEAWSLMASPAGRSLLLELLRDGRKHNAAAWLGSQLPADLAGESRLLTLMATIAVFRLAGDAVDAGLDVLGMDHHDDLADMLTSPDNEAMPSGTCLWRDPTGRIVRVAVAPAGSATLEAAIDTTPTDTTQSDSTQSDTDQVGDGPLSTDASRVGVSG